jgi:hypothetical protein
MVKLPSGKKSPYYVLGVPSFASAREIRAAYLKRVKTLQRYQFDKSKQAGEWQAVNEVLEELNEAYARLRPLDKTSLVQVEATEVYHAPALVENKVPDKVLSHCENTERAVQSYQRLTLELDDLQARRMFIKLIAARGFDESQMMPPVTPGNIPVSTSLGSQEGDKGVDRRVSVEQKARGR